MSDISEKDGFDYFAQTLVRDWDPLGHHIFWKSFVSVKPDKATVTRAFNEQVKWLIANGVESEQEKAKYLKKQFQIDSQKGGRIYLFWEEEMHIEKLDKIEKNASIMIREFQAQHHYSVASRVLTGENNINPLNIRNDNVANTYSKDTSLEKVKGPQENGKSACKDNLKRKRDDDELDYEGLSLLFDESNEDALVERIDEKVLEQENILPQTSGNSVSKDQLKNMDAGIIEAFHKYQKTIPKTRKIFTPAYWGVLDLTGESLYDCKQLTEEDIMRLSQDFANKISWKTTPPEENIREYFDSNCEKKFDGMMTEEELKMSTAFPLFRGIFTSDRIKNAWGEIQALPTNYARNEKGNPFKKARIGRRVDMKSTLVKTSNKFEVIYGEVAGGLGPLGIPTACRKKRYLDKVKLMITMRDGINRLLKECKYISFEKRLELNFYAMDWSGAGMYRFGLIDQCRLPSDEDEFGMLEDVYCILKLLEKKSLEIEKVVKQLFLENTKGKRRKIASETEAELNENRTPER
ncbi:2375_t:CDS:10 [Entrophospora sp. SA101]|nr:2375_t:CDS:10 [Entrophospora sp. SA101]